MRKLINLLCVIFILSLLTVACSDDKGSALVGNTTNINSIKIKLLKGDQSKGWLWMEKEITNQSDVNKVLNKLKSLNYKDIKQTPVNGFDLIVQYRGDKDYTFVFSGDRVNINGKYYGITTKEDENIRELYDFLDYKENPSKP